jgi:hypothetical protein
LRCQIGTCALCPLPKCPSWFEPSSPIRVATADEVRTAALAGEHASVLFIVDEEATAADFPVLVVDLSPTARNAFRCIARELWGVDNNLNLADMEWDEFASSTGSAGVFRGFRQ